MKTLKTLSILLFALSLFTLNGLNGEWVDSIYNFNIDEVNNEIKKMEKELKSNLNDSELLAKIGVCYHIYSQSKEKNADKAIKYLTASLKIEYDPFVDAYLGSAMTLKGGEKMDLSILSKGLDIIDLARTKYPNDLNVLLLRINNGVSMPDFILEYNKRYEILGNDILLIEEMYANNLVTQDIYWQVQYLKGLLSVTSNKLDQAILIWEKVVSENPGTRFAELSKKEIEKYSE